VLFGTRREAGNVTAIQPENVAATLRVRAAGSGAAEPGDVTECDADGSCRPGGIRPDDFEESVAVGRGMALGLSLSLAAWGIIIAGATAGWLFLR
jgi:hypothetical protein